MKKILLTLLCLCAAVAMASATEKIAYTVDFLAKNCEIKVGNYLGESRYHNSEGLTFTTKQFSNNNGIWDCIKCGYSSYATSPEVITNFAVECPITSINIRVDAAQSKKLSACWEIKVLSYPDATYNTEDELQVAYTNTPLVGGDNVIVLDPPQCSRYLKVKFECKSGTSGAVAINGVDYMTPDNASPTWTFPETLHIGEAWELTGSNIADGVTPTVTCSDPSALCAVDGVYYFVKSGEFAVTITTPVEGSTEVSSVSGTVTVGKMPVSLTWMHDGVSVNDQTVNLSTSAVNLPTLSCTAVPAAIADRLPAIPVAVNYNPADQKVLTYDLATGRFTLHGVEAQVGVTASVTGSDIYEDATATVTMDVTNSVTYSWTQAQTITIPQGFIEKETPKVVTLNQTDWTIAASHMFAQWSGGVKLGSTNSKTGTTTFTTKKFAGKVIKGFEITYLASKAMDIDVISGGSVVAAGKIEENTTTPQTFSWSGSRYSATEWGISLHYLEGANLTITGIKVIYTDRSSDTKDEPSWTLLPCEWKFGEGYDLPAIQGADIDGLAVSVTLNPEDVVQDADSGKWYARRPGTVRATAHSAATDKFEEKTLTLSIPVAKGEYLIGWVLDGQQVSTHTCTTLDRNLPTLATRTLPPCLAAIITNPAVDVKSDYNLSAMGTMEYARYDKSSNTITPLYAGGTQTFTAYMPGDANFMQATIPLKVEVKNMYTYGWNSASTLVCSDANEKTTGTLTLGDGVWDFSADSPLYVAKENGVVFGKGNTPGIHFSITRTAPFAGTLIKTFMVSVKGSGQLDLMVDDVVIESITLPGGNLPTIYSISTPVYCDRNIRIAGVTAGGGMTIDQIAVGYEYASTVKTTPVWKANQTVKMYIGGEYDLPAALNVQEGVTVTISPRAGFDDLVRNEKSGKWSPKHAGQVRLVASSPATSRYNAKQETFTIEVPKADLLLGVEYRGELLPDKASIKISTLDTALPKIKLADIPSYIAVPTPTVEFMTDPAILKMDGLTITPIADGEDIVTVSIPTSENFNAASYMLAVTVVPGIPKNIFNLPDERRIYWSEFEDHWWSEIPANPIFDAKYDNLVDYTLRPLFNTTQSKHDEGEGVGIYRDCHWYEDIAGNTLLDTDMLSLHLPCSGEYIFTAALKEGVEVPAGFVARKEMKVTVVPSFRKNAANGDAPLTFNHKNVIEADRLPVNTSYMPYLSNCYVQYHGEGTMSLWVKQQGRGLEYTPSETAVGHSPATPGVQTLDASATAGSQHRATSLKGEIIEGKVGTPVEGYRLYGEDGIDFRKGEEVWLVWEKNGVYSDPIHFTAYSSNDPDITGIDSVSTADTNADADAEYYTLDGYRITTPHLAPGIYIRRTPQATTLQIIR